MLDKFRKEIDAIDRKIIALLEDREKISRSIGKYKKKNKISVRDVPREKEIVEKILRKTTIEPNFVRKIYKTIFRFSRKVQK